MENMYNLWYLCEVVIYIQELLLKSRMHIILSLCKNNVYNFVNIYIQEFKKKKLWSLQSDKDICNYIFSQYVLLEGDQLCISIKIYFIK